MECQLQTFGLGARLLSLRDELGLADCVSFAGYLNDITPALSAFDAYAITSQSEGFSISTVEAMAAGLPVVATDVGGNSEAIVDGEGGWIVPSANSAALAEALTRSAQSRGLPAMGISNRRRVESAFSLDSSVDRLAQWYLRSKEASTG